MSDLVARLRGLIPYASGSHQTPEEDYGLVQDALREAADALERTQRWLDEFQGAAAAAIIRAEAAERERNECLLLHHPPTEQAWIERAEAAEARIASLIAEGRADMDVVNENALAAEARAEKYALRILELEERWEHLVENTQNPDSGEHK
jgi:hypothetical protein